MKYGLPQTYCQAWCKLNVQQIPTYKNGVGIGLKWLSIGSNGMP